MIEPANREGEYCYRTYDDHPLSGVLGWGEPLGTSPYAGVIL